MSKKLSRKLGSRPYRKVFVISTEGSNTEPAYFLMFDDERVHINIARGKSKKTRKSSPESVLKRMEEHVEGERLRKEKSDQYWLVIDKDKWLDDQIQPLNDWALSAENRGLALSNPNFEYWLLLHFEDAKGITSSREILEHLRRYLFGYEKNLDDVALQKLGMLVSQAIRNAKQKDVPACKDWPKIYGTTVYRLIEGVLKWSVVTN